MEQVEDAVGEDQRSLEIAAPGQRIPQGEDLRVGRGVDG